VCGIAGQLQLDAQRPADGALVRRMTAAIAHRGPDGYGHHVKGPIALGHRRLAIIDLETGAQPLCNEDGSVWVVFNGEIYNFRELRRSLEGAGHVFRTNSDTEVIVHLYEEHGDDCVRHLKGMFAIAVWDERRRRLLLARDRVGIKPLYYAHADGSLVFASEIKALLEDRSLPRRFDPTAIDRFLTYYYLPGERTLFEGVRRLPPGHLMTVEHGRSTIRPYWSIDFSASRFEGRFSDAVEALRSLLDRTVSSHLMSDVPLGVLLSGGVDSSGMLAYAARRSSMPVSTFTIGFSGQRFADERPYAALAARHFGATHHEITMSAADFAHQLPMYTWHMEDPVCEPPAIALHAVAKLARERSVKVLLSGEGGDEAFGGYNKYAYLLALESAKAALGPARPLLKPIMGSLASVGLRSLRNYTGFVDADLADYYYSCTSSPQTYFNQRKSRLYSPSLLAEASRQTAAAPTRELLARLRSLPPLHRMLHVDTVTWLPDDLLVKADKMTMATSVELRVPLLDSDVLEFAASLPPSFKVRGWPPKRVLRAALAGTVPPPILRRKKMGFPVPYESWLRVDLADQVDDLLHDALLTDYFRTAAVDELVAAHRRGEARSQEVFSLMVIALLGRQFLSNRYDIGREEAAA
jgi:asparagine synthase (glutamine-hydrolysing)